MVDALFSHRKKKNGVPYCPSNTGCLIGLLVVVYEIFPISLSSFHPVYARNKTFRTFFVAQMVMICCYQVRRPINNKNLKMGCEKDLEANVCHVFCWNLKKHPRNLT